jgi:enamine deaminase RidA (YjgF/YER057c/UK114 family)
MNLTQHLARSLLILAVLGAATTPGLARSGQSEKILRFAIDQGTGAPNAVAVGEASLAHTAQLLPLNQRGKLVGKGDASRQIEQVLNNLAGALQAAQAEWQDMVKINVYLTHPDVVPEVKHALLRRFKGSGQPAVTFVMGNLTHPDALVAMDAIAVARPKLNPPSVKRFRVDSRSGKEAAAVALLPPGGRFYVSGQAKNGPLLEATHSTLTNLEATLSFLGVNRSHVVQLKAFMQPISAAPQVEAEIVKFFAPELPPPIIYVEWNSPTNTPIEIELIAADGKAAETTGDSLSFSTPPGLTASKVFSRVAHVTRGKTIYLSGLYGGSGKDGAGQVRDIFRQLKLILNDTGSDLEHLVKATYYVADEDAGGKLNDIRPEFYNPQRPPAASKAMVQGVGLLERTVTVDMIAVTK